eukprot:jgi/Botrbrau1/19600/Bobra.0035s0078.1
MEQVQLLPVLNLEPTVFPFVATRADTSNGWAVDVDFAFIIQRHIHMNYEFFVIEKSFVWLGNALWLFLLLRQLEDGVVGAFSPAFTPTYMSHALLICLYTIMLVGRVSSL